MNVIAGLTIPLLGTILGAACVFFMRENLPRRFMRALDGFAAGVMVAAAVWSLLVPALEQVAGKGVLAFAPVTIGFLCGMAFLLFLDDMTPHLHAGAEKEEGPRAALGRNAKLVLAITLHNIPEGMAVGVVYAGLLSGAAGMSAEAALALAIGMAIQNFPESAIVSLPLSAHGAGKWSAFAIGAASGLVEPVAAIVTIAAAPLIAPVLPACLAFAAGAMVYVVIEELIPDMARGEHSNVGAIMFAIGFALMMTLDVALG